MRDVPTVIARPENDPLQEALDGHSRKRAKLHAF
jgi:hypothetical protein